MAFNVEKVKAYGAKPQAQTRGGFNIQKVQTYGQPVQTVEKPINVQDTLSTVKQRKVDERSVRLPFSQQKAELGGLPGLGGVNRFLANTLFRGVEDIVTGGAKVAATVKGDTVSLPFRITHEPSLTGGEPVTQQDFAPLAGTALNRINQLDQERPDKRTLNLLQGTAEEVFLPILNAVDIVGLTSLSVRLARKATFSKEATEALKTLNIGLLDDTSEAGIRRHFAQQVQNNIDLLAKEKVTKKEFVKKMDDIGEALDTLSTSKTTRFGKIGERINRVATGLEMERKISKAVDTKFAEAQTLRKTATREAEKTPLTVKSVGEPGKVPMLIEPPAEVQRLDELLFQREMLQEALDNNPAKKLQKFFARGDNSLAQVQKNNEGTGRKSARLDDIVGELGFADMDEANDALEAYRQNRQRLIDLDDEIKIAKEEVKNYESTKSFAKTAQAKVEQAIAQKTGVPTRIVPTAPVAKVTTEQATQKVSKLATRINEDLPEGQKISEFYDVKTIKGELETAAKDIEADPTKALAEALDGNQTLSSRAAKLMEFAQNAKEKGDVATQSALLSKMRVLGTEVAQGLNMFKAFGFTNPETDFMQKVVEARLSKVAISAEDIARAGSREKAYNEVVYAPVRKDISRKMREAFKVQDAQKLFDDLMC